MGYIKKEDALKAINDVRCELFGTKKKADAFTEVTKAYHAVMDVPEVEDDGK